MDVVLEVGHSLSHTNEYLMGTMQVHSHKIGDKTIVHHDHDILKKIEKAVEKVSDHDSDNQLHTVQHFSFDQIKLIIPDNGNLDSDFDYANIDFYYQLRLDQVFHKWPTPPPQCSIA